MTCSAVGDFVDGALAVCRATARDELVKDRPGGGMWHCRKRQAGKQSTGGHHRGRVSEKMRKKRRKRTMAMRTAAVGGAEAMASDASG